MFYRTVKISDIGFRSWMLLHNISERRILFISPLLDVSSFIYVLVGFYFAVCKTANAWFYVQAWTLHWCLHLVLPSKCNPFTSSTVIIWGSDIVFIPSKIWSSDNWLWDYWWPLWLMYWVWCHDCSGGCNFKKNCIYYAGCSHESVHSCCSHSHMQLLWNPSTLQLPLQVSGTVKNHILFRMIHVFWMKWDINCLCKHVPSVYSFECSIRSTFFTRFLLLAVWKWHPFEIKVTLHIDATEESVRYKTLCWSKNVLWNRS